MVVAPLIRLLWFRWPRLNLQDSTRSSPVFTVKSDSNLLPFAADVPLTKVADLRGQPRNVKIGPPDEGRRTKAALIPDHKSPRDISPTLNSERRIRTSSPSQTLITLPQHPPTFYLCRLTVLIVFFENRPPTVLT